MTALPVALTAYRKGDLYRALHRVNGITGGSASWPKLGLVSMAGGELRGRLGDEFARRLEELRRTSDARIRAARKAEAP
jgi:hypothetical protein